MVSHVMVCPVAVILSKFSHLWCVHMPLNWNVCKEKRKSPKHYRLIVEDI